MHMLINIMAHININNIWIMLKIIDFYVLKFFCFWKKELHLLITLQYLMNNCNNQDSDRNPLLAMILNDENHYLSLTFWNIILYWFLWVD